MYESPGEGRRRSSFWMLLSPSVLVSSKKIVPTDVKQREQHIDRIANDAHVRITGILANGDRKDRYPIIKMLCQEEEFGIECESTDGNASEYVERDVSSEQLESALRIGELEVSKNEYLQKVESSCHKDAMPGDRLFELRARGQARCYHDVRLTECGHELVEFLYRDGQVGVNEENRLETGPENTRFDRSTLSAVFREADMGQRDIGSVLEKRISHIGGPVRAAVRDDDDFVAFETTAKIFVDGQNVRFDDLGFFVAGDDD